MANQKIQIANKRTREKRVLSLDEFKIEFANDLNVAIRHYSESKQRQDFMPDFMKKKDYNSEFYLSLQFNFNNYSFSNWYIERFI